MLGEKRRRRRRRTEVAGKQFQGKELAVTELEVTTLLQEGARKSRPEGLTLARRIFPVSEIRKSSPSAKIWVFAVSDVTFDE